MRGDPTTRGFLGYGLEEAAPSTATSRSSATGSRIGQLDAIRRALRGYSCSATTTLSEVAPEAPLEKLGGELCADEGYFAIEQITGLQECGSRTVFADPLAGRRNPARASREHRCALHRDSRATPSASGKALLRKRGEHLERSFARMLDCGGLRRARRKGLGC